MAIYLTNETIETTFNNENIKKPNKLTNPHHSNKQPSTPKNLGHQ